MILKKLASAIRRQDWFQVLVEIMIVIVGIFLGLQVQAWSENRANREIEKQYLISMSVELEVAIEASNARLNTIRNVEILSREVVDQIALENIDYQISVAQCNAIDSLEGYFTGNIELTVLSDLISSGNIGLISNKTIREGISRYLTQNEWLDELVDDIRYGRIGMVQKYPNALKVDPSQTVGESKLYNHPVCDISLMVSNNAFINDLTEMINRKSAQIFFLENQIKLLNRLKSAVDAELGNNYKG